MKRYIFADIKKSGQLSILNLKPLAECRETYQSTSNPSRQDLNLKSISTGLRRRHSRPILTSAPRKNLDSVYSTRPAEPFYLLPAEKNPSRIQTALWSVARLSFAGFLILLLVNILNITGTAGNLGSTVLTSASSGVENLISGAGKTKTDQTGADQDFANARADFDQSLEKISFLTTRNPLSNNQTINSVQNILTAGKLISEAGQLFNSSAKNLENWPTLFIQANQNFFKHAEGAPPSPDQPSSLTTSLKSDLTNIDQSIDKLSQATTLLQQTDPSAIPQKYGTELIKVRGKLTTLTGFLDHLRGNFPAILKLLGDRYPHRYLLLLQNDSETRPTGGFIGSLMIVDINDGIITKADFHDVYEFDGQLTEKIPPPAELASVTDNWHLRDSNYSPDFAISAQKAAWFLQKSRGPSVDTVIAINQSMIAEFLDITGPLEVEGLKKPLDSGNFQFVLEYLIETKHYGEDKPKVILEKTIKAFQKQLAKMDNPQSLLQILIKGALDQKIMLYSRDEDIQAMFEDLHLTPHPRKPADNTDYLQVVATSVGGNKSDTYLTQDLRHRTYISANGQLTDELTITRKHNWTQSELENWNIKGAEFGIKNISMNFQNTLGRGDNKAIIKVYLPLGAELTEAAGVDPTTIITRADQDLSRTTLSYPQTTPAAGTSTVTLRYRLPYHLNILPADIYRFTAEKQLGLINSTITHETTLSPGLTQLKTNPISSLPAGNALRSLGEEGLPLDPTKGNSPNTLNDPYHYSAVISL